VIADPHDALAAAREYQRRFPTGTDAADALWVVSGPKVWDAPLHAVAAAATPRPAVNASSRRRVIAAVGPA